MNSDLVENLTVLAQYYKKTGDNWRNKAYQKAVYAIRALNYKITSVRQVQNIYGIGKSIQTKIKEYLDTGRITKVEEIKHEMQKHAKSTSQTDEEAVLRTFKNIWGVGPVKARQLYDAGFRTLKQLRKNPHLLTSNQKIGLKYYHDLLKPIPRQYIDVFKEAIRAVLGSAFGRGSFRMEIAGSYRRGNKQSGDVDCLLTSKMFTLQQAVAVLKRWKLVSDILSVRDEKFMGIATCPGGDGFHFRLDIEFLPEEQWGSGLLYFTGSKGFNVAMRGNAKQQGYILNQHGLFYTNGDRVPVFTEKEIMAELGMDYVEPTLR